MTHIKKVKTFKGLRYAVVEPFTSTTTVLDTNGKNVSVTKTEELAVEYKSGGQILPAIFEVTTEGLEQAKEVQKIFNK